MRRIAYAGQRNNRASIALPAREIVNMSDNPLEDTPERLQRIRQQAYHLWEEDGRPDGRDVDYWDRARILVGIEESPGAGQVNETIVRDTAVDGVTVDEASIQDNLGEFPDRFTDQGDRQETPMTREQLHKSRSGASR